MTVTYRIRQLPPATRPAADTCVPSSTRNATPIVFVVDDDLSVRQSLEGLIDSAGWHPETFSSAKEFLARTPAASPCCLVLDVMLPDLNGLDLQQRVCAERADMPIIIVTGYGDVPTTVRAMKCGAIDVLTKPFRCEVLLQAIAHALERSRRILASEAELCALRQRHASLSRREREVMALVVTGLSNKRVARELGISEITVKAHRGRAMRKMYASSLPHLVKMASRLGSVPEAPSNVHSTASIAVTWRSAGSEAISLQTN